MMCGVGLRPLIYGFIHDSTYETDAQSPLSDTEPGINNRTAHSGF